MKKKTHEEYVTELAIKNPNLEVIGEYVGSKIPILHKCKIDGYEWNTIPNSILSGRGCPICANAKVHKEQTKSHEQYILDLYIKNPTIKAIEKYINAKTKILHKCKICGHKWKAIPYNVLHNETGCPVCTHKCIGASPEYKNSIWASEYKEYFSEYMSEEQMKSYMPSSVQKAEVVCPKCNRTKKIKPADLLRYGLGCLYCGDGISYPNKFIRAFVEQLPVLDIENEYSPKWCVVDGGRCRYDVYFKYNNKGYIIEMDGGLGHGRKSYGGGKDEFGILKDEEKDRLAREHNITMIRIDSQISKQEYIKKSILESKLNNIFDLTNIDWEYCDKQASSSNVFKAATLWNNGLSVKVISNELGVYTNTTAKYLKQAAKLGICNYSKEESRKRGYAEVSLSKTIRSKSMVGYIKND